MQKRKRVAIICGGQSAEHEISLLSAYSIASNLDLEKFIPLLIGITKDGHFVSGDDLIQFPTDPKKIQLNPKAATALFGIKEFASTKIDLCINIVHGTTGEDGVLSGFLTMLQIPYIGSNTKASSLTIDKHWTKIVLQSFGINCGRFAVLFEGQDKFDEILASLGSDLFVKPASLGSSVGITHTKDLKSLKQAVTEAFKFDTKLIIEQAVIGREIEIGVLGNESEIEVSSPAEIVCNSGFYDYNAKYIDANLAELIVPASLSASQTLQLKELSVNIFKHLELSGFARIDFFLRDGQFILNEVNTLPGFTKISMFPRMFINSGYSYKDLITRLLELAIVKNNNVK